MSLHLWQAARPGVVDLLWVMRYTCLWTTCALISSDLYGILVSLPIQLYRFPFFLQPISLLGYSSLEALVIFVNCTIALFVVNWLLRPEYTIYMKTKPLVVLLLVLMAWVAVSSVIWDTNEPVDSVIVATMPAEPSEEILQLNFATAADAGVKFVVLPEGAAHAAYDGSTNCTEEVQSMVGKLAVKHGMYVTVGCVDYNDIQCGVKNMAITISPTGEMLTVYGKMRPIPGETSCYRPGYFAHPLPPEALADTPEGGHDGLKFSSLICYDMDYTEPAAEVADLGASLVLNPSSDWQSVRHHFAVSVMKAVENRIAVVKAEDRYDAAIISPWGKVVGFRGLPDSTFMIAKVPLLKPFQFNKLRQQCVQWVFVAGFVWFTMTDIVTIFRRRRIGKSTGAVVDLVVSRSI